MKRMSGGGKQLCPCQCHPDLSWLVFGDTRIAVTDVDMLFVVQRKSDFLFIEWKELDEEVTTGQSILLEQLSHVPRFTVLILRGTRGDPRWVEQIVNGESRGVEETSKQQFQKRIDRWFAMANGFYKGEDAP